MVSDDNHGKGKEDLTSSSHIPQSQSHWLRWPVAYVRSLSPATTPKYICVYNLHRATPNTHTQTRCVLMHRLRWLTHS